ncbi:MAG: neutral/alkaline non-lysosomal ceramidase N-terminal domain-containing protein [Synoicihabitans sp.]
MGVAHVDITPLPGEIMTAMGGEKVPVAKIHDPLLANVIVFVNGQDQLAIVSLDLIALSREEMTELREQIRQRTGIDNVICSVSHTHGSGRSSSDHIQRIMPLVIETAVRAHADLTPARLGFGKGAQELGYNRRVVQEDGSVEMLWNNRDRIPSEPTDPEVGVMVIKNADDGTVIATLVNYAVHPVISMNFGELIISADYPGVMARAVEDALGGRCIFFLGAAGDINPFDADMFRYATPEETFTQVRITGELLAREVIAVAKRIDTYDTDTAIRYDRRILPMASRKDGPDAPKNREIELNTILLGSELALVTFPGEMFVELGLDLKARSPAQSTWVLGLTNDINWYIPTLQATTEGGYGATWGTDLEVGAGERLVLEALVSLHHQKELVKPLR